MAIQGLTHGCPRSPLHKSLLTNDLDKLLNMSDHGAMPALQTIKVSHSEYADNIALTANTVHHLQLQLDRFHTYTSVKGLTQNMHKAKIMAFFCSGARVWRICSELGIEGGSMPCYACFLGC